MQYAQHAAPLLSAPTSAAPLGITSTSYTSTLDPTQLWSGSAHFPMQSFSQPQLQNAPAFAGLQNPAVANQLAWMSQNAALPNRSTVRYNRPNIWPMASSNAAVDLSNTTAIPNASGSLPAQNNAVDMNALFNLFNSNPAGAPAAANANQWNQAYTESMDNIMLDDFVSELMSLIDPLVGGEGASTVPQTSSNTPTTGAQKASPYETPSTFRATQEPSSISCSATGAQTTAANPAASSTTPQKRSVNLHDDPVLADKQLKAGSGKAPLPGRASNRYRKLLDSDAIESLLSKYSPIYERFWHATLMLLSNKKRQAAVDYLMSVVRSNKACRASVVVVCLAYHELVQRIRKGAQKSIADAKQPQREQETVPPSWTTVAIDAVQHSTSAAARPQDGMTDTTIKLFERDSEEEEEEGASIRSDIAEDSDRDTPPSNPRDEQERREDDSEDDLPEEISVISRHPSGADRSFSSTKSQHSSDRYGSTSFSRRPTDTARSPRPSTRPSLTGKLSTVEDNISEMDDPSRDAFKGQVVEEHTVELWFDIARAELSRSQEELTLDQELCAIINLRWACLCFAGAERARQLTEELGKVMEREGIDLVQAGEEEKKGSFVSAMLLTAVYTDVLDTVSDRGKRTHVTLGDANTRPAATSKRLRVSSGNGQANASAGKTEPFFGRISLITLEMLTCFKLISDLSADVWGPISSSATHPTRPSESQVAERSREIERKVMSLPPWSDPNTSSSLRVRAFALQEIWRQTARLYLLQAVHRRGPLFPELQNILHEIIRLAKMVKVQGFSVVAPGLTETTQSQSGSIGSTHRTAPPNYIGGLASTDANDDVRDANHADPAMNASYGWSSPSTLPSDSPSASDPDHPGEASYGTAPLQMWLDVASWEMCTVWFLCCTVSLTRADRQFCIHHLESSGLERANRDNIQVIRDYWAKQDGTGYTLDWFDFIKSTGRSVVFAF